MPLLVLSLWAIWSSRRKVAKVHSGINRDLQDRPDWGDSFRELRELSWGVVRLGVTGRRIVALDIMVTWSY